MENIVLFLAGERGLRVVDRLISEGHGITMLVSTGGESLLGKLKYHVDKENIELLLLNGMRNQELAAKLKTIESNLFIVAGFPRILSRDILGIPKMGTVNLHAGPVPNYRGGSPLNWQIINGEQQVGISILDVGEGIDTGDVLCERMIELGDEMTIREVHDEVNKIFPEMVIEVVDRLSRNSVMRRVQDDRQAIYWHQRNDADGCLDFETLTAKEVLRYIRALTDPYPGAWAKLDGKRVRIYDAKLPDFNLKGVAGRVCFILGEGPFIICSDRAILVTRYIIPDEPNLKLIHGQILNS